MLESEINELVSIVMPTYNCSLFIEDTIISVINQSYKNWELIIVDDCSTDNTHEIVNKYLKNYNIKYIILSNNLGAALARNRGIELAQGRFIAFLDSDDIWYPQKLAIQIKSMIDNNWFFSCTGYDKINEDGKDLGNYISTELVKNYKDLLKNCPGNSTVIYDASNLGKYYIPDIKRRNDYIMWLMIIKNAKKIYGINSSLGAHRVRHEGISRNKFKLVKYHWLIYRRYEKINLVFSSYLTLYWVTKTIFRKRMGSNK